MERSYPSGPPDAKIMLVGEASGREEIETGRPFANPEGAGGLLSELLSSQKINREDCFITNCTPFRPPNNDITKWLKRKRDGSVDISPELDSGIQELEEQINSVKPETIITLGNTPLWALTGEWGITKWRGSMLTHNESGRKVLPTYHPAGILRNYSWKWIAQHDLRTARKWLDREWPYPNYEFFIDPPFRKAYDTLNSLLESLELAEVKLAVDLETSGLDISCIGIAWHSRSAICIPFLKSGTSANYWIFEEEVALIKLIKKILEHPNAVIIGQNFNYDRQFLARCWGIDSKIIRDTMTYHHTFFSQLPKGLDFLSSLYCEFHKYWKDETKTREEVRVEDRDFWNYNCKDCVVTYEVDEALNNLWNKQENKYPIEFQMSLFNPTRRMVLKGVKVDKERQRRFAKDIEERMEEHEQLFLKYSGGDRFINIKNSKAPWWRSYKQTANFFYDELGIRPVLKSGRRTVDDEALKKIGKREPLVGGITTRLQNYRSLGTYYSTFVLVSLDWDGRIRCQYKIDGTETFRFASSEDAFGFGTNLQNIPKGAEGKHLPNVRAMFVPDTGRFFWDSDLKQADARIVAWEADCRNLKEIFKDPSLSIHNENCKLVFGKYPETEDEKSSAKGIYQKSKRGIHALNYGVMDKTLAQYLEITVHQAYKFRNIYFSENPEIPAWHDAVQNRLASKGWIYNRFGFFTYFFHRPEKAFKEALAWIPQSTVGLVINHGLVEVDKNLLEEEIEPLLQVHDSLAGQGPLHRKESILPKLKESLEITIPYEEPLTIPVDIHVSDESWGGCK